MLVIGNGRLVTRDPEQPFFENGAVAMDGTAIKKVGTLEEIKKEFPDAEYVDAKGGVIMPAFINTHAKECFSAYRQNTFAKSNTVRAMNKTADIYSSILSRKVFRSNFPSFIRSTPAYFFAW